MMKAITSSEAIEKMAVFLEENAPRAETSSKRFGMFGLSYRFARVGVFGAEARVDVSPCFVALSGFRVEVAWGSSGNSVVKAVTMIELYKEATAFAALVETFTDGLPQIVADPTEGE